MDIRYDSAMNRITIGMCDMSDYELDGAFFAMISSLYYSDKQKLVSDFWYHYHIGHFSI